MADVMNGRFALADPSSGLTALSLEGGELNMFGKCTRIRTTQRDSFPVIDDAPTELKVVEESNSLSQFINGAIGLVVGVALGAVAVALIAAAGAATGGAALPFLLGAIPFMVASTAAICTTVQVNEYDKLTGYNRSPIEFSSILAENVNAGYAAGAMIAAVLEAAPGVVSYVGINATARFGLSNFTEKAVPAIVKIGIGSLVTTKGIFTASDIEENSIGYNRIEDKVFNGDRESYEVFEEVVDGLCEGVITSGGMMPLPTSSMLRWVDDIQDTDGYKHSGGTGGGKGNTADVPSIDINEKRGGQSTTGFDMPVQQHISPYAHTGNIEGTGENTIGSNKSAVSYSKGLENGIGIDTNKQIDPSLNSFSGEGCLPWNGQQDIQLEIFDGDAEGLYIEYRYDQEDGVGDEEDEYADIRVTNEDLDDYRYGNGIEEVYDPRRPGVPLNTLAIGRTNVPGLEGIDFVGRSSAVRKAMNDPTLDEDPEFKDRSIRAPYSKESYSFTRHAEEDLIAHFEKEVEKIGLLPEEVEGTLYIHQSNFNGVCSACTAGLPDISKSTNEGIFLKFTEKYPKLKIVVTSDTRYGTARGNGTICFNLLNGKVTNWSKR